MSIDKSNNSNKSLKSLHLHWGEHSYQGQKYRSYSLARSYREDGKNKKEVVVKLGKLSDDEATQWKEILQAAKKDGTAVNLDDVRCSAHFEYLDVMTVSHYWDQWKFSDAFPGKGRRQIDLADIAKILTINRCLDPCAKSLVPTWFKRSFLALMFGNASELLNASRIFRELDNIEDCKEGLCSHIINKIRRERTESLSSVFFDLSSTKFYGQKSPLVKWGRAKEGYVYHAVLALLVTEEGLPLYWDVLEGGTHDTHTLSWLVKKVGNKFPISEITLVFDRGMVSEKNLKMLEDERRRYITALDKNQIEDVAKSIVKQATKLNIGNVHERMVEILKPIDQFDDHTFIIEDKIDIDDKRRYLLIFNTEMFIENQRARQKKIDEFHEFVTAMNRVLESAENNRAAKTTEKKFTDEINKKDLADFVKIELQLKYMRKSVLGQIERTRVYEAQVIIDEVAKEHAGRLDGFWTLITNQSATIDDSQFKISPKKIIKAYRDKYKIEESFRDIKSFIEIAPVHVWTEKHIRAHYTICVLAHAINRTIAIDLAKQKGDKSKDIISARRLYEELHNCKVNQLSAPNTQKTSFNITTPSPSTKDLLHRLNLEHLLSRSCLNKIR